MTRVGPGTPMGDLFRCFWLPALLASELPQSDGPPVRVRLLGEDLIAFRDTGGKIGLLAANCSHRGASLFFGRNEDHGLRCVYHGWKYDIDGRCVDMPNEPPETSFGDKIHHTAYPCLERGGIIWAYLGANTSLPPGGGGLGRGANTSLPPGGGGLGRGGLPDFPALEWTRVPATHVYVHKRFQDCNYLQNLEGEVDSSHISFLHRRFSPDTTVAGQQLLNRARDGAPRFSVTPTDYGLLIAANRRWDEDHEYCRITQFLAPSYTMIPAEAGHSISFTAAIPADDYTTWGYTVSWRPDRPLEAEDVARIESWTGIYAEVDPKSFMPVANRANDYLIDRNQQRSESFTGIRGIREQDLAVQEGMGPIYTRSGEHLGAADAGVVATRQYLLQAMRDLQSGIVPEPARNAQAYAVRSAALVIERGALPEEAARSVLIPSPRAGEGSPF